MKPPQWLGARGAPANRWMGYILGWGWLGRKIKWCRDGGIMACFYPSWVRWGEPPPHIYGGDDPAVARWLLGGGDGFHVGVEGIYEVWK